MRSRELARRLKPKIFGFGLLLLPLAIVVELGLRFGVGFGDPPLYMAHPRIEYMMRPGIYKPFGRHVFINSAGMRSPEAATQDPSPNQRRLLVLGDSIVNGGALTDDRDLATTLLESEERGVQQLSVCNISAGSWGPGNWLAYLREYGTFGAKFAIIVLNDADAIDAPTYAPLGRDHPTQRPQLAMIEVFMRYLPRYLPASLFDEGSRSSPAGELADPLQDLASGIDLLRDRGLAAGAILFPSAAEVKAGPGSGTLALRRVLEGRHVPIMDPLAELRLRRSLGESFYLDGIHPSAAGHRSLCRWIRELLVSLEIQSEARTNDPSLHH